MIIKTRGIVFRTIKYSETSFIVDIYTEERGLRKYIISGVRSKRSKVSASLLQAMSLVDLVVYHRDDKELTRIKEIRPAHIYQKIPFQIQRGAVGLFMIEVAQKSIKEAEENQALFNFLFNSFVLLDKSEYSIANVHLHFLLELTTFLGFMPGEIFSDEKPYFDMKEGVFARTVVDHRYSLEPEKGAIIYALLECSNEKSHQIKISRSMRQTLVDDLLTFYRLHIENFPTINSHMILKQIME